MFARRLELPRGEGLHARPASELSFCSCGFESDVVVRRAGVPDVADAKSPVALMALTLGPGEEIDVIAMGPDEREAVEAIASLVESWH